MLKTYQKTFIALALARRALSFGEFTLKSGRKSPYFFNMGHFSSGEALKTVGECYAAALLETKMAFDVLFGPAYKGIPLVCTCVIALADRRKKTLSYAFNRKEAKSHGDGGSLVGAPVAGKRVLILDDVITAGTALREAVACLKEAQAMIAGVVVAFDREEKGEGSQTAVQEMQAFLQVPVTALVTFSEIMAFVKEEPEWASFVEPMERYRAQYGA